MAVRGKEYKYGAPFSVIFLIGLMWFAAGLFGYMEAQLLNTYIDHVLNYPLIFIGIMVSFSAIIGLIFLFTWGVMSDNTRTRYGMRRPYLLAGGLVMGFGLILFGFSYILAGGDIVIAYFLCFFIDVIIIGIASNAFYAAQRVLIPDLIETEYRGRVNGLIGIFSVLGLILPVALTLFASSVFAVPNPDPQETGSILTQEGHIFLLTIGGTITIICGILGFIFLKDNISASELPPKKTLREEFKATFNIEEIRAQKQFFRLILANTVFMCGMYAVLSYIFNFIFSLEISTTQLMIVLGVAAPTLIIALLLLGSLTDKLGRKAIVPPTIVISCIGFIMIPFITESSEINIALLSIAFSLILLGILGVVIPLNTWSQDLLPEDKRGQFSGIYNIVNTVSQVVGSLTAGIVATMLKGYVKNPIAWVFIVAPFFFAASIPLFLRVQETLPEEPRADINE